MFMLLASSPAKLLADLSRIAEIVIDAYAVFGLEVNLEPGKSEACIKFWGEQSKHFERLVFHEMESRIPIKTPSGERSLFVVQEYVHLGTVHSASGGVGPEIARRCMSALTRLHSEGRALFKTKWVHMKHRLQVVSSLLWSVLLFQSHTWPPLSVPQQIRMHTTASKIIRKALNLEYRPDRPPVPDYELYYPHTNFVPVLYLIQKQRLLYLPRLLNHAPSLLHALIQLESTERNSWAGMVRDDLCWVWAQGVFASLPDPRGSIMEWKWRFGRVPLLLRGRSRVCLNDSPTLTVRVATILLCWSRLAPSLLCITRPALPLDI